MSFLLSLCSLVTVMSTHIKWVNDHVIIPLYDNLYDYITIPEAFLYIDDELIEDSKMYYERDRVERTFLSTVSTNYVKSHTIYYRVHFPTYDVSHTKAIIFEIKDFEPPEFIEVPSFKITLLQTFPSFTEGLRYRDNYDAEEDIKVFVNTTHIVKNRVGIYPIYYKIVDSSGNESEVQSTLEIYDHLPPDVTLKSEIIHPVGEIFSYHKYINIKDNYDLVVSVELDLSLVDFKTLGDYTFLLSAKDQSDNETRLTFSIKIIDKTPPQIKLNAFPKEISVHSEIDDTLLKSYILWVYDNYDDITIDDVSIFHDIDTKRLGSYTVYFHVYDLSGNFTEAKLNVAVVDDIPPTIEILYPLIFDVYDPLPHFIDYIKVTDNFYDDEKINTKITTSPKMNTVGSYQIIIEAKDPSQNVVIYRGYVEIVDRIPPNIEELSQIIIVDFQKRVYDSYFSVTDQYSKSENIRLVIDDSHVNYNEIGIYPLIIYAYDESFNETIFQTEILVLDIHPPILSLKSNLYLAKLNDPVINLYDLIDEAYDDYDDLSLYEVMISHNIQIDKIGVYEVIYMLSDQSHNTVLKILEYRVDDYQVPIIKADPLTISFDSFFNPWEGLIIEDHSSNVTIAIYPLNIDTSKPGNYHITYIATDERGRSSKINRVVTVLEPAHEAEINDYVPMLIVLIVGAFTTYYFWKKR